MFFACPPAHSAPPCPSTATDLERNIVNEMNHARQQPLAYVKDLEGLLPTFDGYRRHMGDHTLLETKEGSLAVTEAINYLKGARPRKPLRFEPCLSQSSRDHVADHGPKGLLGHDGSRGEHFSDRIRRHGVRIREVGENISYGSSTAAEVVRELIVDDGVRDRGHRRNIFNSHFTSAGAACGPHQTMGTICVIDFSKD